MQVVIVEYTWRYHCAVMGQSRVRGGWVVANDPATFVLISLAVACHLSSGVQGSAVIRTRSDKLPWVRRIGPEFGLVPSSPFLDRASSAKKL